MIENHLKFVIILAGSLWLAGCATRPPSTDSGRDVDTRVRQPASQESAGIQVYPLQNPAVKQLLSGARQAEDSGDYEQAVVLLERALRIQPRDPEILQHMAEVQLQVEDYQQALHFAVRSYDIGPRVGEICSRNWRTISLARENLGDRSGSAEAEDRAGRCMSTKPRSY
jgi:tetratricopeptide (TPR) repeat protein